MNRIAGAILLIAGAVIFYTGWQEKQTVDSRFTELVSGTPSDQALWLMIGGGVAALAGLVILIARRRRGKKRFPPTAIGRPPRSESANSPPDFRRIAGCFAADFYGLAGCASPDKEVQDLRACLMGAKDSPQPQRTPLTN